MSELIDIWGGRSREGIFYLEPFSDEAVKTDSLKPLLGYISKFPTFSYSTEWGDWDHSNSEFLSSKIRSITGGGTSIPARIVQMLAGSKLKMPVISDQWTQRVAENKNIYLSMEFSIIAFPVIDGSNGCHVEGMRYDSDNMNSVLMAKDKKMSSMWDWLSLGKTAMMPSKRFSTKLLGEQINAISENLQGSSGKMMLHGASSIAHTVDGFVSGSKVSWDKSIRTGLKGAEEILNGVVINGTRVGHTFTAQILDCDRKMLFNSKAPDCPLDFYVTDLKFDFSQHLVKIVDERGVRKGAAPEFCEITLRLDSVTKLSPDQVLKMCNYDY